MRRIALVAAFAGVGMLVARAVGPKLHDRLMARCENMFERAPDTFPPKRMMNGIDEVRRSTARIMDLLEAKDEPSGSSPSRAEAAHDAA